MTIRRAQSSHSFFRLRVIAGPSGRAVAQKAAGGADPDCVNLRAERHLKNVR